MPISYQWRWVVDSMESFGPVACRSAFGVALEDSIRISAHRSWYENQLALVVTVLTSLSCEPDAVTRPRLKPPAVSRFMDAVEMGDPDCNVVSVQCAYRINGVLVEAGTNWRPPPLILWFYFPPWNPPTYYSSDPYPESEDRSGYFGATVGTSDMYLAEGGQIVESSCDPSKPGCLLPLTSGDSSFLVRIRTGRWFKPPEDLESQEEIDQCQEMRTKLLDMITETFNRPANDTTHGLFRGSNDPALVGDDGFHGGAFFNGSAHLDAREWDTIYAADSLQWQPRLVTMLLHEAAHALGKNHPRGSNFSYNDYPYFRYVQVGDNRSCVWNYPY